MSGTAEHSFKSRPPKKTKILLIGPRTIENYIYNEGSQYIILFPSLSNVIFESPRENYFH